MLDPSAIRKGRARKRYSRYQVGLLCDRSPASIEQVESGVLDVIVPEFAAALADELDLDFDLVFAPVCANRSRTKVAR